METRPYLSAGVSPGDFHVTASGALDADPCSFDAGGESRLPPRSCPKGQAFGQKLT
jgi:hypothetical protein